MSWEIFLQAFEGGDAGEPDARAIQEILGPLIVRSEPEHGFVVLVTSDGQAEVYGFEGEATEGLTVTGLVGDAVWQVVFDLMERGRMVAMPLDSPVCATSAEVLADLPEELRDDVGVVVVRTAAELAEVALGG